MSVVVVSVDIDAPPQEVWDYALDPHRTTEWVTIVREVSGVDEGPLRTGFRLDQVLVVRGVPFTVHWALAAVEAPWFAR